MAAAILQGLGHDTNSAFDPVDDENVELDGITADKRFSLVLFFLSFCLSFFLSFFSFLSSSFGNW